MPTIGMQPCWNWMSCGPWLPGTPTRRGSGSRCAARRDEALAYAVGDRSEKSCRCLWEAIPPAYRVGHGYTDFWSASQVVIAEGQHTAAGKETGETAHGERWKNTLRQRLARFVRKTLSFSQSWVMPEACLQLFLHRYHRDRAITCAMAHSPVPP